MSTPTIYRLNLYGDLGVNSEPLVFEFPVASHDALVALCQDIRDAWTSGTAIFIQNPAGSEYVCSAHVARFSVS